MKLVALLTAILLLLPLAATASDCRIGGCSGEICETASDTPTVGICIWSEVFACYKTATCEKQTDGKCSWTQTPELEKCITEKNQATNLKAPMAAQ